jgi:hypothetical protein
MTGAAVRDTNPRHNNDSASRLTAGYRASLAYQPLPAVRPNSADDGAAIAATKWPRPRNHFLGPTKRS